MLKIIILLILFSLFLPQNVLSLENLDRLRCIQNNKCEYFEDDINCPSDCSPEALQKQQRESRTQNTETPPRNIERPVSTEDSSLKITIISIALIILILVLITSLYYWFHKKPKKRIPRRIQPRPQRPMRRPPIKTIRRNIYSNPSNLPQRPRRRF